MPMGKGTYGSKVGRPSKAAKAKGMKKMAKKRPNPPSAKTLEKRALKKKAELAIKIKKRSAIQ